MDATSVLYTGLNNPDCHISKLATETRCTIWKYVLQDLLVIECRFGIIKLPALMSTCKEIQEECIGCTRVELSLTTAFAPDLRQDQTVGILLPSMIQTWTQIKDNKIVIKFLLVTACRLNEKGQPTHTLTPEGPTTGWAKPHEIDDRHIWHSRTASLSSQGRNAPPRLASLCLHFHTTSHDVFLLHGATGLETDVGGPRGQIQRQSVSGAERTGPLGWYNRINRLILRASIELHGRLPDGGLPIKDLRRIRVSDQLLQMSHSCNSDCAIRMISGQGKMLEEILPQTTGALNGIPGPARGALPVSRSKEEVRRMKKAVSQKLRGDGRCVGHRVQDANRFIGEVARQKAWDELAAEETE